MTSFRHSSPTTSVPAQLLPWYPVTEPTSFHPLPAESSSSTTHCSFYTDLNSTYDHSSSLSVAPPVCAAEEVVVDPFFSMPVFQAMDSAALVAAALGPTPAKVEDPNLESRRQKKHKETICSSPLTELSDCDSPSITERWVRRHRARAAAEKARGRNRRASQEAQGHPQVRKRRRTRNFAQTPNDESIFFSDEDRTETPEFLPATSTIKKAKKRLVRKKPVGMRVPQTLETAGPADRMMWEWKNMGKSWQKIRDEWQKITGIRPGTSTLSVRYLKLNENFALNGAAGDRELLRFKREADEEFKDRLWGKVAEKMLAFNEMSEHNPRELKKRYDYIVRSGAGTFQESEVDDDDENENEDGDSNEDDDVISVAEVKDETCKSTDEHAANADDDRGLTITAREDSVHETQTFPESHQHIFDAPFAFNLVAPSRGQMSGGIPDAETMTNEQSANGPSSSAATIPTKDTRSKIEGVTTCSDNKPSSTNQMHPLQMSTPVTSSPPLRLGSSPFFKSLVAYESEDE